MLFIVTIILVFIDHIMLIILHIYPHYFLTEKHNYWVYRVILLLCLPNFLCKYFFF